MNVPSVQIRLYFVFIKAVKLIFISLTYMEELIS